MRRKLYAPLFDGITIGQQGNERRRPDTAERWQRQDSAFPRSSSREPKTLQTLIDSAINTDGLCIIDSAGNRPEFDKWIAQYVDLVLIPVMPDPEDVKEALVQMDVLESQGAQNVRYLINNYPSGRVERRYVERYLRQIPLEKAMGWIGSVKALRTLRENDDPTFQTPPTSC